MMPVQRQPEPADFDIKVRRKGLPVLKTCPPPPVPSSFWNHKEYWRESLDDLMEAYGQLCAYTAFRIERTSGARTVDHFLSKSRYPKRAYEWENFRLVSNRMNGRKGEHEDVLDPFEMAVDTFGINIVSGEVYVHADCPEHHKALAKSTINRLKLNSPEVCLDRQDYITRTLNREWTVDLARKHCPFIVHCLETQRLI